MATTPDQPASNLKTKKKIYLNEVTLRTFQLWPLNDIFRNIDTNSLIRSVMNSGTSSIRRPLKICLILNHSPPPPEFISVLLQRYDSVIFFISGELFNGCRFSDTSSINNARLEFCRQYGYNIESFSSMEPVFGSTIELQARGGGNRTSVPEH